MLPLFYMCSTVFYEFAKLLFFMLKNFLAEFE